MKKKILSFVLISGLFVPTSSKGSIVVDIAAAMYLYHQCSSEYDYSLYLKKRLIQLQERVELLDEDNESLLKKIEELNARITLLEKNKLKLI